MTQVKGTAIASTLRFVRERFGPEAVAQVHRIFFKLGSPHFVVSRAARVWRTYYDAGEMRAVVAEPGHAVLDLEGFAETVPELCERLIGWMSRSVELAGGKNLRSAHSLCVLRGDAVCRFEGWWE